MIRRLAALACAALALPACSAEAGDNRIVIDRTKTFQTMTGWEVAPRLWEMDKAGDRYDGSWLSRREEIADALVDEIGVNRIRLEIGSGAENPEDHWSGFVAGEIGYERFKDHLYEKINDNRDPRRADGAGFQFAALDYYVENLALPMKARLEARGERLIVNLCYVDFKWSKLKGSLSHADAPEEYAELIDAAFEHLQSKYGLAPDYFEIVLEPDNTDRWTGEAIADGLIAVDARLSARGVHPRYIAPSTAAASRAAGYLDEIARNGKALALLDVVSYHRYDGPRADTALAGIRARATKAGAETAMLEFVQGRLDHLYRDLTDGGASAWQRYGVATIPGADGKSKPGYLLELKEGRLAPKPGVAAMAEIFRNVREGAVRIDARSLAPDARALAFRNADGADVVLILADKAGAFMVEGAKPGRYRVSFAPKGAGARRDLGIVDSGAESALSITADAPGVIALKSIGPSPAKP